MHIACLWNFTCRIFQAMFSERIGVGMNPPTQRSGLTLFYFRLAPKGKKINYKSFIEKGGGSHTHQCKELAWYMLDKLAIPSVAD